MESRTQEPLTTYQVSRYLHVDLTTVINWCDQGKLKAYKTPGGHRRVQKEDLLLFLKGYQMPVPPELIGSRSVKILIVDDESDIRRVVRRGFKKVLPEAECFEAQDGFEAGKLVLDTLPQLVILDLKLPGVDGFRVCENIRGDKRFDDTKILAVTGQDTVENRKKILDAGADAYLPKPFHIHDLMAKALPLLGIEARKETVK